jgi:hypothetical protein
MDADAYVENALAEKIQEEINRREQSNREAYYQAWCDHFASLPEDFTRMLKDGFIAHVELQPWRWIQHGLELIASRKGFGTIQLIGSKQGPDFRSFLPYPVFQMGAEIFLKGMWLFQHEECRDLTAATYVAPDRREHYLTEMKKTSKTHDLLEIIRHVEVIRVYVQDVQLSRFLKILGGISKEFYLPVTDGKRRWADERYPKRFYDDSSKIATADAYKSYPEHWPIARLFAEAADRLEIVWQTRH